MSTRNDINKILLKKFPHLEISVVKYSEVQTDNESKRIDSEYFKQAYLENEKILKNLSIGCEKLGNLIYKMTGGATPLGADYPESGIPFLRVQNIMPNYFNLNDIVYISNEDDEFLKRSKLKIKDVLLTITGAYGKAAVVYKDLVGANINQHSVKIEVKKINPYFLATFINSKHGQLQCHKKITGVTRPALDYRAIKNFLIPMFSKEFQLEIEAIVKDSHKALENSKKLYKEAESILYEALGLDAENPLESILSFGEENKIIHSLRLDGENSKGYIVASQNYLKKYKGLNISIRTYKESYLKTGRLDAQYYQEKFRKNEILIKNYSHAKLIDLVNIKKSIEPGSEAYQNEGIEFIRVANFGKFELSKSDIYLDKIKFINELEKLYPQKDTILLTKDGSIGMAYCVPENLNCITSGAILHLKIKNENIILPQVLTLIINSIIGQLQAQRDSGGAIISHWTISEIENILIPLLDLKTQRKIGAKVKQSFELRDKSKELLENAKAKIEKAIIDN